MPSEPAFSAATHNPSPADSTSPDVVVVRSSRRRRTLSARREGERIVVRVPAGMDRAEESRHVSTLVSRVLAKERRLRVGDGADVLRARSEELCRRHLDGALGTHAPRPSSVRWVSNQRQRWGSCTIRTGAIRLSDRLRELPVWVVDYVLLHELIHLIEPHHTARFKALLAGYPKADLAEGYLQGYVRGLGLPAQEAPSWAEDDVDGDQSVRAEQPDLW